MIRPILITFLLLSACGGSTSGGPGFTPPPIAGRPEAPSDVSFASLLNGVRISNGAESVIYDPNLGLAAQSHADDMLSQDYFSHVSLDGSTFTDRAEAAGYDWVALGENIAQGQTSQTEVMDDWTNSPGHHANNISTSFEDFGLGRAGTGSDTRWVLMLGRE